MGTGLGSYEGLMTGRTTQLGIRHSGDGTHERLSMTNEPNPEDLRRAQTEADHGGHVDVNAQITLEARRSQ